MFVSRNRVCLALTASLLLPAARPARADGGFTAAAVATLGPLAWECTKGGAQALGAFLFQKGREYWGDSGELKDPAALDAKLREAQAELAAADDKKLADAVSKLRAEITPNMKVEEYYQKVISGMAEMDRRVGKLEDDGKKTKEDVKDLHARLARMEQREDERDRQAQARVVAERRLKDRGSVERSLDSLRAAKASSLRREYTLAAAELTKALEPIYRVKKSFVDAEMDADVREVIAYIFMARGDAYVELELDELAMTDYTAASLLTPSRGQRAKCFEARGDLLLRLKKATHAVDDYSRAIELSPSAAVCYAKRAKAYRDLGDDKLADGDERAARGLPRDR